jgi:Putative MetA-pathway of phenol degradation
MKRRRPRPSALAPCIPWLGAGVIFVLGITGWASESLSDEASALFGATELSVHMGSTGGVVGQAGLPSDLYGDVNAGSAFGGPTGRVEDGEAKPTPATDESLHRPTGHNGPKPSSRAGLKREENADPRIRNGPAGASSDEQLELLIAEAKSEVRRAGIELAEAGYHAPREMEDEHAKPSGGAVPKVAVRVGDHGDYERVVFEWPEEIDFKVVQRAEQVTVEFSRPGRIDLSPLRSGSGQRVVEAWAGGDVTDRVLLRVVPGASIRTFSPDGERTVAIDVYAVAVARSAPSPAPEPDAEPEQDANQALRQALEQRDAVIDDLLVRMEQLERRLALSSGDLDSVVAGGGGAAGAVGGAPSARPVEPPPAAAEAAPEPSASSGQQAPAASQSQGGDRANEQAAPGEFDVAEQDIDRALERTLVQTGVLLLPFGQAEIEPFFSYTREEGDVPVVFAEGGRLGAGNQEVRRNEFVTGQTLRVGLPFDSQAELDLPYRYVDQSVVTPVGFGQREDQDGSGHGLGDLRVGLAKTLLRENGGWWPDLVARVTWDTATGNTTDNDVVLGGGFNELRGSLTAVKRQDPLAFVGGVSYEKSFENDDVQPGDEIGVNFGTVLAASPATSLRLALNQTFTSNTEVAGEEIDGSDDVVGTATFGASVVLGRGVLLDVAADIGLTDDAPDYAARASLPIRFNLPVY